MGWLGVAIILSAEVKKRKNHRDTEVTEVGEERKEKLYQFSNIT